ncbi:MAG: acyl-CoA thioesterase [Pseudomonadota bacterium]
MMKFRSVTAYGILKTPDVVRTIAAAVMLACSAASVAAETVESDNTPAQVTSNEDRVPAIRVIAMPADMNPFGTVFGGWLMAKMDLAAGSVAARTAEGPVATVAVDSLRFFKPVRVGDEVSFYANLIRIGNTSMTIRVEGWNRPRAAGDPELATEATFHFVAIDENGQPRPVQP